MVRGLLRAWGGSSGFVEQMGAFGGSSSGFGICGALQRVRGFFGGSGALGGTTEGWGLWGI